MGDADIASKHFAYYISRWAFGVFIDFASPAAAAANLMSAPDVKDIAHIFRFYAMQG